ncbi:MAG TPA: ATP-binding protein [Kribbella sp.]
MPQHEAGQDGWHVPPWVRVPRLEAILGCRLGDLDWSRVAALASDAQPEDLTLEYKERLYGNSDAERRELAKDVASLANASGGLLIIGLREGDAGEPHTLTKVALEDAERNRMRQILSTTIAPLLPDLQMGELRDPADPGRGVFLILVPASDSAPHGVQSGDRYSWPVRHDRTTHYMREPEIAARYRDRAAGAGRQATRLAAVRADGRDRLWSSDSWLAVSVVPAQPGRIPTDIEPFRHWLRDLGSDVPWPLSEDTVVLGRRRVIVSERMPYDGHSRFQHLELHSDGAGFAAMQLTHGVRRPHDADRLGHPETTRYLHVDAVARWTLGLLHILANHAVRAGGSGDLLTVTELLPSYPAATVIGPGQPVERSDLEDPLAIVEDHAILGDRVVPGSRRLTWPTALETTVPISVVASPADLVAAAADIARELVVEFGALPTNPVLGLDGRVNPGAAPRNTDLVRWAERIARG